MSIVTCHESHYVGVLGNPQIVMTCTFSFLNDRSKNDGHMLMIKRNSKQRFVWGKRVKKKSSPETHWSVATNTCSLRFPRVANAF